MSYTILIVDDEDIFRQSTEEFLTSRGYETRGAATLSDAREKVQQGIGDVILLDVDLPDGYGPNLLYETVDLPLRPPVIVITGVGNIEMAVDAMKNGAHDFIAKPIIYAELEKTIARACEIVAMRRELNHLRDTRKSDFDFVAGDSAAMKALLSQARRAAIGSASVLITGENGTGKEVLTKFMHNNGPRANKLLVGINCAAIQSSVLESELFGHESGAFTNADKRKLGLMEIADGGSLFLDEISSMPLDMQAKLLRALEERSFFRVGGTKEVKVDVQVVAASNRDLKKMIADGSFREDLYYRLKVVNLHIPSLRERKADIPELVGFYVRLFNKKQGLDVIDVTPRAMQAMLDYKWPGNIRELRNAIERAMLFCDGERIDLPDLPADIIGTPCAE